MNDKHSGGVLICLVQMLTFLSATGPMVERAPGRILPGPLASPDGLSKVS